MYLAWLLEKGMRKSSRITSGGLIRALAALLLTAGGLIALAASAALTYLSLNALKSFGGLGGIHLLVVGLYLLIVAAATWFGGSDALGFGSIPEYLGLRTALKALVWLPAVVVAAGLCMLVCVFMLPDSRDKAIIEMVARLSPLPPAIHAYEKRYSRPPKDLKILVPEFLPAVPAPDFYDMPLRYAVKGEKSAFLHFAWPFDDNPWALYVPVPDIGTDMVMIYLPLQDYPTRQYDGHGEGLCHPGRVKDWACVQTID